MTVASELPDSHGTTTQRPTQPPMKTPDKLDGYEKLAYDFIASRGVKACTHEEAAAGAGIHIRQLQSALLRIESTPGLVARFLVDEVEYLVAGEHLPGAYVDQPFALPEATALLYACFGSRAPATIRRTPQVLVLGDDQYQPYSRFARSNGQHEDFAA